MTSVSVEARIDQRVTELARRHLSVFVHRAWRYVEPDVPLVWNWHLDVLCDALESVTRGETSRLIINIPPGTSKSLITSSIWPAWEWAQKPSLRYLCGSYSAHLSIRDNLRLRNIVRSQWYQDNFWNERLARAYNVKWVQFSGDQNSKVRFDTTPTGWRIGTSVGGAATGEHPDRIIVDDPLSAEQARSVAERDRVWNWFRLTLGSRGIAREAAFVLIMQRLHEQDPSGHLLDVGGWRHIMLPMRFEPARADPLDQRTKPGELLWPALFTPERVQKLELILGQYGTAGQLQQRPSPQGGGLFKSEWFEILDAEPAGGVECRGWDTAATTDGGDFSAGVKMKHVGPMFYVTHVARGQWGPHALDRNMASTAVMDGKSCRIREEQEPGASGKIVIADRTRTLVGYDYKGIPAQVNKELRANPYRAQCEANNVKLLRGEWNQAYLDELANFPTGLHDDQVDGSSTAFNELALGPMKVRIRPVIWG